MSSGCSVARGRGGAREAVLVVLCEGVLVVLARQLAHAELRRLRALPLNLQHRLARVRVRVTMRVAVRGQARDASRSAASPVGSGSGNEGSREGGRRHRHGAARC